MRFIADAIQEELETELRPLGFTVEWSNNFDHVIAGKPGWMLRRSLVNVAWVIHAGTRDNEFIFHLATRQASLGLISVPSIPLNEVIREVFYRISIGTLVPL